jgi:hypothetical protein
MQANLYALLCKLAACYPCRPTWQEAYVYLNNWLLSTNLAGVQQQQQQQQQAYVLLCRA